MIAIVLTEEIPFTELIGRKDSNNCPKYLELGSVVVGLVLF